jgi:glycosyltransferase involved in cell wall biosynthesis
MKVIIVAPHFHPRVGGVETYALHIATELVRLGWQVVIVTTSGHGRPERATVAGLTTYRLPVALTVSNTPIGFSWRRRLRQIFRLEKPDVITAHTPVPYLADLAQRTSGSVPFVLTYHNDLHKDALVSKLIVAALHRTMIDRTLRRATKIIATSDDYVRQSRYLRPHAARVAVVPPGVDTATFRPDVVVADDLAARYAGQRVVLFVGSLNRSQRHKGLDLLIRAFARLAADYQDARLVIVGTGDGLELYRALAAQAGLADRVTFTGYVASAELAQYYKLATVFAMPSTDRSEGFGMVYAEASAVGTAVIGARVGGVPFAVRHNQTGLLVPPRSVDDLGRALRELLDDDALAGRLGAAGAARAKEEFAWGPLGERTSDIFKELATTGL